MSQLGALSGGAAPIVRPGTVHTVTVSGTTARSGAVASKTRAVRIVSTVNCHYTIGATSTATTDDSYLPANVVEYIWILGGEDVAFIQAAGESGGTAYVSEAKA